MSMQRAILLYPAIDLTPGQCRALTEVVHRMTKPIGGVDEPGIRPLCRMDQQHVIWSKAIGPVEPDMPLRSKVALIRRLEARSRKHRN